MLDEKPDSQAYERARKRVEELRGFYSHLLVYLAIMAGLFLINILTSPHVLWFLFPAIGWGVFVVIHGVTFLLGGPFGQQWEERKTRELMERDRSRWGPQPPVPRTP